MRTSRTATLIAAATLPAIALIATPAQAASSGDTTVTFTIAGGALNITAPASKSLGTGTGGTALVAQLGAVTVTDSRAALAGSWTATAAATTFTTGGATPEETIGKATVMYMSGTTTATTGTAVILPGQTAAPVALTAAVTAHSAAATVGNNSATWNPTLMINVPAQAIAGTYTGTVTHSVS